MASSPHCAPRVSILEHDVNTRLRELGCSREELVDVAVQAFHARGDSIPAYDPWGTPGTLSYVYGTRALRQMFVPKGWRVDRAGHLEGVSNDRHHLKFVFQNVDQACIEGRLPRAISGKGGAAERQVESGQKDWVGFDGTETNQDLHNLLYFLCVSSQNDKLTVELLCPRMIRDKQFYGYLDRIFILKPGDTPILHFDSDDEDSDSAVEVDVTKKSG